MDQVDSVSIPDMSGHGRHGVIYGDIEWVEGVDGSAIQLDATDRIVVPVIDVNISTTTMTAWVRPDQIATSIKGIVYRRGGGSVGGLKIGPGNELGYTWNDNPNAYNWQSGLFVPAREWSFIALVLDPSQAALCLNGTSIQRTNTLEHLEMAFDQDMTIGHDPLDVGRRFVGALDDVRFYNRALSEDELADVLAAGTRPEREADPLMIEDFDAYNAYSDEGREDVWDVWADGYGGNGTGSTAGYVQEPFMSRSMVVNGGQALPLGYDNTGFFVNFEGKPAGSRLSEIVRSFSPVQDFTRGGATSVTFWLKGDQANTAEAGDALYLGVKDATGRGAVVTVGAAADLRKFYWVQKKVALSDLAGADLTKVTDLFLGVGTRAVPQTGGVGTILVDDITLVVE